VVVAAARSSNLAAAAQEPGGLRKDNLSPVVAAQQELRAARFRGPERVGLHPAGPERVGLRRAARRRAARVPRAAGPPALERQGVALAAVELVRPPARSTRVPTCPRVAATPESRQYP